MERDGVVLRNVSWTKYKGSRVSRGTDPSTVPSTTVTFCLLLSLRISTHRPEDLTVSNDRHPGPDLRCGGWENRNILRPVCPGRRRSFRLRKGPGATRPCQNKSEVGDRGEGGGLGPSDRGRKTPPSFTPVDRGTSGPGHR